MKSSRTYLTLAIISLLGFGIIAFVFGTAPFHSTKDKTTEIERHVEKKLAQTQQVYEQLKTKSNDAIADEISKLETGSMQLFVYGKDNAIKVWTHAHLPTPQSASWWKESEHKRICYKTIDEESTIIACEEIENSHLIESSSESNYILQQSNTFAEFLKYFFFFLFFFSSFLLLKQTLFKSNTSSVLFFISSALLVLLFLFCSERFFNTLEIFDSSNFSSGAILSPASLLFGSFFVLLSSISFSNKELQLKYPKYLSTYFVVPSLFLALFLKGLEHLFIHDSNIQFENISFEQFALWGYSLGAILLLYSIHMVFQTFMAHVTKQKLANRYTVLATILISYLAFHFLLGISIPWYIMVLYLICYYFSLELNSESLSSKLIWTIWFLILNAGLISSVLYYYTIKKDIRHSQEYLSALYTVKDSEDKQEIKNLQHNIESSEAFKNLFINSNVEKFHKDDLLTYLSASLPSSSSLKIDDVFLFDKNGESRIINENKTKNSIRTAYLGTLGKEETRLYNPIDNTLLFEFAQDPNTLFIALSEKARQSKLKERQYGLFAGNTHLSGDITALPDLKLESITTDTIIQKGAASHIYHIPEEGKTLYAKKTYSNLLRPISLFSFIFCLSGIFVFLISVLSLKFDLFKSPYFNIASFGALSTKIQMVIIFLILLSFLAIAVVTSLYFNQILKNNQEKNISAKVITINNSLQNRLANVSDMQSAFNIIENELPNLSDVNNVAASFYNKQGLNTSSTKQVKAYPFYPYYQHKAYGKNESYTLQSNNTVSAYFPITHPVLGNVGYISLDDKRDANNSVRSSISEFLSSMLNLYVFLFFIAGALAIAISKSITRPLTALQARLKSIQFGSKNELIEWKANDEIGELITSYNDMLVKLEQNIELLAKTERDTAWREMAKQVAHEIKNPLTPMKLSIQYLKRAIQSDPNNSAALVDKISNTLIEQIDNLAEIANAFSNFATLPQANNDKIVLNEVVELVHDLFRKRDDMEIKLFEPLNSIEVFADKNHMIRILNNLVKNAIQAIPEERKGVIAISLYKENDKAVIKVEDNGKGIPKELQAKVFTPYFTTKTSGTGLGLAISINMLSAFDGRIYFKTTEGKGTSFFIEIPLMRETYKYHEGEKLILD